MSESAPDDPTRNQLAEDRTLLANERTFGSWMRTSLACIALGVGFQRLFAELRPEWLPRLIATGFLLLAILVIVTAERRAAAVQDRLDAHSITSAKPMNLRLFTGFVAAGAAALTVAIWLE